MVSTLYPPLPRRPHLSPRFALLGQEIPLALFGTAPDKISERRQAAAITGKLAMLRAQGLIIKIQKIHRYQVSASGRPILAALLAAHAADVTKLAASA